MDADYPGGAHSPNASRVVSPHIVIALTAINVKKKNDVFRKNPSRFSESLFPGRITSPLIDWWE
jgi:hypothetical protein